MIARSQQQGDGAAEGDAPESTDAPELHDPSEVHKPSRIPNRRWQYSNVPAPLPPRDAALHRRWKEAEPGLEHVVLRDAECDRALGQYFPKVPRGAGSMSFALRAAVCGLVAVWHDGGYYVHRDVAPGKPLSQWLLNHTGPSELVAIQSSAGPEALVGFFFGAVKQQRCVAAALDAVAGLPADQLFSSRFAADGHDERRHDVPREVTAPLLGDDCAKVRFELQWTGQMELPETPHAHSPMELHVWNETDTGPGVGDDLPLPWRRWVVEESGNANAARVDSPSCATAFEAVRGEAAGEAVSKGMAATEPELRRTLCAAMQMRHTGGIAVTRPLTWVRPTALWLPEDPQLVLVADANATDAVLPGFIAGRGSNPCIDALAQKVADAWSAGDGVTQAAVHGVVADCGTLLPATIAQGDGFLV